MNAFWEKGYEACSTADLCQATGLGKGSLYNAFGSKHEIYAKALKLYHQQWMEEQNIILSRPTSAIERIRTLFDWAIEKDFEQSSNGCFLINASMERGHDDITVQKWSGEHARFLENKLRSVIDEGVSTGELASSTDASAMASNVLCIYYGLRTLNATLQDKQQAISLVNGLMASLH
ncbi:TetR/AcrR family transcriptional regulator [Companilactobacillus zhongbaensis]|uniref:TetR/AcrR family transcriptional regulator n=1 Tax=Companilactobacillus zhongbaensis TaxID=2486009 RepID=UPI000F7ADF8E|nr:TetR/AcrR family transcriptional regulator [Companilactobacillus zhongbaensis]